MFDIREYVDARGSSPFARWFDRLDGPRCSEGHDRVDPHGAGQPVEHPNTGGRCLGYRIDFGPGYRVYFGRDGEALIVLLGGGTKARQQRDIDSARRVWEEYRRRKSREE